MISNSVSLRGPRYYRETKQSHINFKQKIASLALAMTILINFTILVQFPAYASLNLKDLIETAKSNNPDILKAKKDWEAAKAASAKYFFLEDPKIGIDYEKIPSGSSLNLSSAMMKKVSISQEIPFPMKLFYEGNAASKKAEMFYQAYLAKEKEVLKNLKTAYFKLYKTEKLIELMTKNISYMKQMFEISKSNYVSGKNMQIDVIKAEIELVKMKNDLLNMQSEKNLFKENIRLLLNSRKEIDVFPEVNENEPYMKKKLMADENIVKSSPKLLKMQAEQDEADNMLSLAKLSYVPDLMAKIRKQEYGDNPNEKELMLEFSIPLWFPINQNSMVSSANLDYESKKANYDSMKNMLLTMANEMRTDIENLHRTVLLYKNSIIPSTNSLLSNSLQGYRAGKIEFIDLLDSERTYLATNSEYYEKLAELNIKIAELEEIIGGNK